MVYLRGTYSASMAIWMKEHGYRTMSGLLQTMQSYNILLQDLSQLLIQLCAYYRATRIFAFRLSIILTFFLMVGRAGIRQLSSFAYNFFSFQAFETNNTSLKSIDSATLNHGPFGKLSLILAQLLAFLLQAKELDSIWFI